MVALCESISLPLSRIMSCEQSTCESSSLWLTLALFLAFYLAQSLIVTVAHPGSLTLTYFGPLWLSTAHFGSLWHSLCLSQSLIGSQCPCWARSVIAPVYPALIWCQPEGRELVKCYHFASFCDSVPTSNSTGRWSGLANRGEIGERANKQYHLLQYLSEHLLVLLMTISTRAEWKRSKL